MTIRTTHASVAAAATALLLLSRDRAVRCGRGRPPRLARRMTGTAAEGNAKAKTGSIANVRALSGYVTTRDGERLVFSIIANNFNVPTETIDAAVVRLAEFSRK